MWVSPFCKIPPSPFRRSGSGESLAHELNFLGYLAAGRAAGRGGAKSSKLKYGSLKVAQFTLDRGVSDIRCVCPDRRAPLPASRKLFWGKIRQSLPL